MVTRREKQNISSFVGGAIGFVGGVALGVYAGDNINDYLQANVYVQHGIEVVSGFIGIGLGTLTGMFAGGLTGQVLYNKGVKMNFGKSHARIHNEEENTSKRIMGPPRGAQYKVLFETKGPANQYAEQLMEVGLRNSCALCPEVEFTDVSISDYNVLAFTSKEQARKDGEALVTALESLDFVVSATYVDKQELN